MTRFESYSSHSVNENPNYPINNSDNKLSKRELNFIHNLLETKKETIAQQTGKNLHQLYDDIITALDDRLSRPINEQNKKMITDLKDRVEAYFHNNELSQEEQDLDLFASKRPNNNAKELSYNEMQQNEWLFQPHVAQPSMQPERIDISFPAPTEPSFIADDTVYRYSHNNPFGLPEQNTNTKKSS